MKARISYRADGSAQVVLPTGDVAEIGPSTSRGKGYYDWRLCGSDDSDSWGTAWTQQHAYNGALYASAKASLGPKRLPLFSADDAWALERGEHKKYASELKRMLRAATGCDGFRVSFDRGTAASWCKVKGATEWARCWIARIFGQVDGNGGYTIPPTRGYRAWAAARAAGLDGSEIERGEHAWD